MLAADLAGFCAAHDLVRVRDTTLQVSKLPAYRGRSLRDLTQAAYQVLLSRFIGPDSVPMIGTTDEAGLGVRMAAAAKGDAQAQRRAGVA